MRAAVTWRVPGVAQGLLKMTELPMHQTPAGGPVRLRWFPRVLVTAPSWTKLCYVFGSLSFNRKALTCLAMNEGKSREWKCFLCL